MSSITKKEKPATLAGVRASEKDQLGSEITSNNTFDLRRLQALRLSRRFALSLAAARLIAELHFGEARHGT